MSARMMQGDCPKGYKQTEVGVIPEDWVISGLGRHLREKIRNGYSPVCPEAFTGLWTLSLAAVTPNGFEPSGVKPAPLDDPRVAAADLAAGDIVVSRSNTPDRVGLAGIYRGTPSPCSYPDLLMRVRVGQSLDNQYLLFHLLSDTGRRFFAQRARGSSGSMVKIDRSMLEGFPLPLPPTKAEQEAIAEALSDADALIESLEHLIAKKRQVKQGAMQELLTGKRRLPGFSGEWEVKRLGELAEMGSGGTPLSSVSAYYDGDIPWVSISDMTNGGKTIESTERNLSALGFANSAAQMFPAGTVLYAMYASVGECSIAGRPLCSSQAILGIRTKCVLDAEFLYYYLMSLKPIVKTLGQQGTQSNLNKGMVQDFRLKLPPLPEQTAIAAILSDMDAEIAELEAKLAKARQVKQGMMQELLTGRIRLV